MRQFRKRSVALLLGTLTVAQLAGSLAVPAVQAAGTQASATAAVKISPVTMSAGVTATVEDVNIWTQSAVIY
ncbi:hypothetical protein [Paenibacillus sp. DMB5]|uniref:hypothetical protein n=1 Tax=Paenibacillus sp. DMB5 TaxID=1780103 RepID=UPI00076D3DDA|nr:hypothetical protein [Paenibacillus sp. DMB5]KUP23033.1 hypothetical protein AWJ19_12745 [Paenibacillus sp. DMB5]